MKMYRSEAGREFMRTGNFWYNGDSFPIKQITTEYETNYLVKYREINTDRVVVSDIFNDSFDNMEDATRFAYSKKLDYIYNLQKLKERYAKETDILHRLGEIEFEYDPSTRRPRLIL